MNPTVGVPLDSDKLDEVIEQFELDWIPDRIYLESAVERIGAIHSRDALTELLRSDIDLRYRFGAEVDLMWYWDRFESVRNDKRAWQDVAFEDFRARRTRGLSLELSRWKCYEYLHGETWYEQLSEGGKEQDEALGMTNRVVSPVGSKFPTKPLNADGSTPEIGRNFGEFFLHGLLGTGAFSRVYLATQPTLAGRYVALKVVNRTLDEPTHLARLQHTGIVPLYSLHRIGPYSALCMPYYGAATLAEMLAEHSEASSRSGQSLVRTVRSALNRITIDTSADKEQIGQEVESAARPSSISESASASLLERVSKLSASDFPLWFATKTAAALAHAHERQVIHGDLKPANILIRNDGEPALIDFNLSQSTKNPVNQLIGGTLPYMSPEQMRSLLGRELAMSPASDVFSFGVVMFQLIEGKLPFEAPASAADSDVEIAVLARKTPVELKSPRVSSGLKSIVIQCLNWDPARRYSNASELLTDLECEASSLPLKRSPESFFKSRFPKAIQRNSKLFSVLPLTLALLSVALLCGWVTWKWHHQSKAHQASDALSQWDESKRNYVDLLLANSKPSYDSQLSSLTKSMSAILGDDKTDARDSKYWNGWTNSQRASIASDLGTVCLLAYPLASEKKITLDGNQTDILQRWRSIQELNRSQVPTSRLDFAFALLEVRRCRQEGDLKRAEEKLHECVPDSLTAPIYWIAKGELMAAKRQYDAASIAFEQSIEAAPSTAAPYYFRAQLREQRGKFEQAEKDYTRAIEYQGRNASLLAERARLRSKMQKWNEAIEDMDKAIEILPSANRFYLVRSRMLLKVNRVAEAKKDHLTAMQSVPQSPEDWISRALAHLPKNPRSALSDLRSADSLDPGRIDVLQNIAHVLNDYEKDTAGAIEALSRILEAAPRNEMALADRAVLLASLGKRDDAKSDIGELLQWDSRLDPSTFYQIACAYAQLSQQDSNHRTNAMQFLALAIFQGYGKDILGTDTHLEPLREDPQFRLLVTLCELANQKSISTVHGATDPP